MSLSSPALASHYHSGKLRRCRPCRRQPSHPTITAGSSDVVVLVVASPRIPLSQREAQTLSSLSSPALASHYHSGKLRRCRPCRRQPSPPTITAGSSDVVVLVVASPRLPLSQREAQTVSSLSSPALASHYHSRKLRRCRPCRRQPSAPTITAGSSDGVVLVVASPRLPLSQPEAQTLSSLSSPALASHYHSGKLRRCRPCRRQPSPPTITAGSSDVVVLVVASPRLPLSQPEAQTLSSLSSPALGSHHQSGKLRRCRPCRRQPSPPTITAGSSDVVVLVVASPRLPLSQPEAQTLSSLSSPALGFPLSQREAQTVSSLSSPALASHYHSGKLRRCRPCRRQPSPPTITAGSSDVVVLVVASPRLPLSQREAQTLSLSSTLPSPISGKLPSTPK